MTYGGKKRDMSLCLPTTQLYNGVNDLEGRRSQHYNYLIKHCELARKLHVKMDKRRAIAGMEVGESCFFSNCSVRKQTNGL